MSDSNQLTLRPPSPGAKHICVIDPDSTFSILLDGFLSQECAGKAELVAVFDKIPDGDAKIPHTDVVLFDPTLPEFRRVDGIARVQRLFGETVILMARLRGDESAELLEDLRACGVSIGVLKNDFEGIVNAFKDELSRIVVTDGAITVTETIVIDGSERPSARTTQPPENPNTAITPLRPIESRVKITVHVCIVAEDEHFARMIGLVLMRDLGNAARIEGVFDHVPQASELSADVEARLVIFDPEAEAFHRLTGAIAMLRSVAGDKALVVARTDNWRGVDNRYSRELLKAGILAGCARDDYVGFVRIAAKLSEGAKPGSFGN